ncbi:MAG: zinc ribbon domain-containing protein [Nitrososphaerota archaeon]|nr:zinc ribbon domain-containing protein [Nitrososphaerota archaeon]
MNYCPHCGVRLQAGQNFCTSCGADVRETSAPTQTEEVALPEVRGLGRKTAVFLTAGGVEGVEVRSSASLISALLIPLPFVAAVYYVVQAGAPAVYVTLWVAAAALLYDELRWRGVRRLDANPPGGRRSWLAPWNSIRTADWNGRTLWLTSADPRRKLSATFDREDASSVESWLNTQGVRHSWKSPRLPAALTRFWTLVLLLFITGQAILILAATLPFFPGEEQAYSTILTSTKNQIAGTTTLGEFQAIFLNNIQVAWGGAMPFLGTLTYGVANYNTGRVVQEIAISTRPNAISASLVLASLYVLPHTWVEESAYPIATIAGILATTTWRSVSLGEFSRRSNWGSTKLVFALAGTAAILAAAGFLEVLVNYLGFGAVLLWVPMVALYYLWTKYWKRTQDPPLGSP